MYIKKLSIQGFKSYKDQINVEPFSEKHNVIVGRNGSGKSNFFAAIRFALGDAYVNMGREERQSLLHEGSGPATMNAYVEVVFDNSDHRFPTGKDELTLRRTIGQKQDEYSLDNKNVTKTEVFNLFESAGFSRSNPYYIVPQGRINAITHAKDSDRLELLKEVAGTKVYETRRVESLKILEETALKQDQIQDLIKTIEERLKELQEEKKDLTDYRKKDRERRCLEYAFYSKELESVVSYLDNLEKSHQDNVVEYASRSRLLNDTDIKLNDLEESQESLLNELLVLKNTKDQLQVELEELIKTKTKADLRQADLERMAQSGGSLKELLERQLQEIRDSITDAEVEIENSQPQYDDQIKKEKEIREKLENQQNQLHLLYLKKGRLDKFRSKSERDAYFNSELKTIRDTLKEQNLELRGLRDQLKSYETKRDQLVTKISKIEESLETDKDKSEKLIEEIDSLKTKRDNLSNERKGLWHTDAKLDSELRSHKEKLFKFERSLFSLMDNHTRDGLNFLAQLNSESPVAGLYGPLYQLFKVDEPFRTAVEVAAGASLFHVVVDTDETATKLMDQMKRKKVGRVTFIPINRLKALQFDYSAVKEAFPLIKQIKFENKFTKVFDHVFGSTILCPNLVVATEYSKTTQFNAITADGDRVDKRGALTGGFHDSQRSRLQFAFSVIAIKKELNQVQNKSTKAKARIQELDREITQILGDLQKKQVEKKKYDSTREPLFIDLSVSQKELNQYNDSIEQTNESIQLITKESNLLKNQQESYETELKSAFTTVVSFQDQESIKTLTNSIETLKKELYDFTGTRINLENKVVQLKNQLESNLRPRKLELQKQLESNSIESNWDLIMMQSNQDIQSLQSFINTTETTLTDSINQVEEYKQNLEELKGEIENYKTIRSGQAIELEEHHQEVSKYLSMKDINLQKKNEYQKNIRNLGVLPEEAFSRYMKTPSQKLLQSIHKVKEELKKYSHINKKADEQFDNFDQQRDNLLNRQREQEQYKQSIEEMIEHLDNRKDEAIERTFKQVALHFSDIFEKLVPQGKGTLVMQRRQDSGSRASKDNTSSVENFIGVSIKVSFNSKSDEGLRVQQLSGGQKSLVALTLIFAIQKCDPAPFYLFDEIDANLDAAHRTSVANMIHELSDSAQFITTTFRPELLVNGDKFYGVTFSNRLSKISTITRDDAKQFVELEHTV